MATKKKKNGRQNYDWEMIKHDYVSSDLSLRKIAEKYKIRLATVSKKSKADDWFATKQKFKKDVSTKAITKLSTKKADSIARMLAASDTLMQRIEQTIADTEQFNRHIVNENAPAPEGIGTVSVTYEKTFDKVDTRAIKDIAQSMKTIAELLGYQTPGQIEKQKLDREKFEFEKQQALDKAEESSSDIKIVIDGYDDEWSK